jgi:hypothetical protein
MEKKLLNCKVKCIDDRGRSYTKDGIYICKDGRINSDDGDWLPSNNIFSIRELNEAMISKFELYEEKTIELTLDEIAKKFNCNVEQIKIKK